METTAQSRARWRRAWSHWSVVKGPQGALKEERRRTVYKIYILMSMRVVSLYRSALFIGQSLLCTKIYYHTMMGHRHYFSLHLESFNIQYAYLVSEVSTFSLHVMFMAEVFSRNFMLTQPST